MLANVDTTTHPDEIQANSLKIAFLSELDNTVSVYHACKKLGISRNTVYNEWLKNDSEFREKWNEVRGLHIEGIEGNLLSQALHKKEAITAQIFALKAWKPEIYGDRAELNINQNTVFSLTSEAQALLEASKKALSSEYAQVIEEKAIEASK